MTSNDILIVSEFTTNHMGNMNLLLRMVEETKKANASIIKMQKKNVETSYSPEKLNMPYSSPYGKTYKDYRTLFEFNKEDFQRFNSKCIKENIPWFITIQDKQSLDFIKDFEENIPFIKVASINIKNKDFLNYLKKNTNKPLVLSTGGSNIEDIDYLVSFFDDRKIFILQCTSSYPCPDEDLKLGNIIELKRRYNSNNNIKIGYSGHEKGYIPSIIASLLGAEMIERHFCISRDSFVHHIECSLEPDEFSEMVDIIKNLHIDFNIHKKDNNTISEYIKQNLIQLKLPYNNLPLLLESKFGILESEKLFLVEGRYKGKYFLEK